MKQVPNGSVATLSRGGLLQLIDHRSPSLVEPTKKSKGRMRPIAKWRPLDRQRESASTQDDASRLGGDGPCDPEAGEAIPGPRQRGPVRRADTFALLAPEAHGVEG